MNHSEDSISMEQEGSKVNNQLVSRKSNLTTKSHRNETLSVPDHSPDVTSRYGRTRKPKECDDFLPTDAVLGKSPRSPKKEKKAVGRHLQTPKPQLLFDDISSDVAYIQNCSNFFLDKSDNALLDSSNNEDEGRALNDIDDSLPDDVVTDYEPGDLIWGRIGHHPFWPCIIINDPEFNVFYKTTGHGRLLYHVLFYGDNGKRSWVPSSSVLRFLGSYDFQSQISSITPEMKKKDTKWFSGFFVKSSQKQKWDAAVQEAESAMPMTRDERVDAFLRNFPEKQPRSTKKLRDGDATDSMAQDKSPLKDTSPNKISKFDTPRQKKESDSVNTDTPSEGKRKRGRPKKIDSGIPLETEDKESEEGSFETPSRVLDVNVPAGSPSLRSKIRALLRMSQEEIEEYNHPDRAVECGTDSCFVKFAKERAALKAAARAAYEAEKAAAEAAEAAAAAEAAKAAGCVLEEEEKKEEEEEEEIEPLEVDFTPVLADIVMEGKGNDEFAGPIFRRMLCVDLATYYTLPDFSKDYVDHCLTGIWDHFTNIPKHGFVPSDIRQTLTAPVEAIIEEEKEIFRAEKEAAEKEAAEKEAAEKEAADREAAEREGERGTGGGSASDATSATGPCSNADVEGKDDDKAGVAEEVATVVSNRIEKSSISKKEVNLFRGYRAEKVCQVCEKPGNTVRCRGPCSSFFHVECTRGADDSQIAVQYIKEEDVKPKKRGRKKKLDPAIMKLETQESKAAARHRKIYAEEETDSDLDYDGGDTIDLNNPDLAMMMIMGSTSYIPEISLLLDEESEDDEELNNVAVLDTSFQSDNKKISISEFRCGDCAMFRTPLCFACGQATDPSGQDSTRHRCSAGYCGKHFHERCLKLWPQANHGFRKGAIHNLTCPQHVCHTCISDNPRESIGRISYEKLVRCIRCPTSYHYGNYCVPAGCEILSTSQMICPRHYKPPKKGTHHVNASWCFICSVGGSLICCDLCPSSVHVECLKIKPPEGSYICEDCETGRFPLYNEVLWVKLGTYRWWPARTLFPSEVPDNVKNRPHTLGEFAVRFLGTNDHYWIHRGRCFVFHEGDSVQDVKKTSKSSMDNAFLLGVKEANELHKVHKEFRAKLKLQAKSSSMKPPQYIKIKSNKPMGKVKMFELDVSNISPCECDPNSDHPCSPDVDCLNRILLQECDPNICPAGERCENQCFEKRLYPPLEPYRTDGRGWGLKTLVDLKKGSFVIEYVGEVIDDEEYQRRLRRKHDDKDENYYFLTIDSSRIIDAGPKGNVSRFMNHSCHPNCETQKWTVAGDTRVGLFALRDIPANSELTFNYNLESKGNEKKPCMCGAAECSGFIGAKKKLYQPEVKTAASSGKKKRKKPRIRNLIEDICLTCNQGTEKGDLITCINKDCASRYHLNCAGLTSVPPGKWLCGRHRCNLCEKRAHQWCSYCTDSYCPVHLADLLFNDPLHGFICEMHQKNPTSVDDHKKKREEERKQKEDEKRKRDEEERAQRRSRRERIVSDEEVTKKKSKHSVDKGDVSETSSEDSNENKLVDSFGVGFETTKSEATGEDSVITGNASPGEVRRERNLTSSPKSRKDLPKFKVNDQLSSGDNFSKQSSGKFKVVKSESPGPSFSYNHLANRLESKQKTPRQENTNQKGGHSNTMKTEGLMLINRPSLNVQPSDNDKDEVPGADPSLDKFILKACEPIDDKDTETCENADDSVFKRDFDKTIITHTSATSIKKRRKETAIPNLEHRGKLHKKARRAMDKDMKGDLSNELEDFAMTFASDGQGTPNLEAKKVRGQGLTRGRGRRSLGLVRTRVAGHNVSKNSFEFSMFEAVDNSLDLAPQSLLATPLKSPTNSKPRAVLTPEKVSTPAVLFAMQRAKGSKVLPPNRRLSSARELASNGQDSNDFSDRIERAGKGVKVLKVSHPSLKSHRAEKFRNELTQGGPMKRSRSVLSRVEENGANLEDDTIEKTMDSISIPKQSVSTPSKKKTSGQRKQSANLGVCPLWNQDIMNIMQTN